MTDDDKKFVEKAESRPENWPETIKRLCRIIRELEYQNETYAKQIRAFMAQGSKLQTEIENAPWVYGRQFTNHDGELTGFSWDEDNDPGDTPPRQDFAAREVGGEVKAEEFYVLLRGDEGQTVCGINWECHGKRGVYANDFKKPGDKIILVREVKKRKKNAHRRTTSRP